MRSCDRRAFIKWSATLAATVAAGRVLPPTSASPHPVQPPAAEHPFFAQAKNHPEVIAHRGGNGQWPGETLLAYKEAVRIGVDVLEMDVYLTKDKRLALMHDVSVKKTTDGRGLIHKYTLAELQELNAAYNWSDDG